MQISSPSPAQRKKNTNKKRKATENKLAKVTSICNNDMLRITFRHWTRRRNYWWTEICKCEKKNEKKKNNNNNKRKTKKNRNKNKAYNCHPCHTSVLMRVLCSVLSRGVGHIRQLYPRDNWPDRDAKQVWRHFEERARSQVRDTANQLAFPSWVTFRSPNYCQTAHHCPPPSPPLVYDVRLIVPVFLYPSCLQHVI